MYCTTKTLKYILTIFNILCMILGSILIWFGSWTLQNIIEDTDDHGEYLGGTITIVLGTVILTVALFGCIAIYRESKYMLISYAVILMILVVVQIILLTLSYTAANGSLADGLQQGFDELWDKEEHTNSTLSYYEEWLQCCGKNSAQDYLLLDKIPPSSCCKNHNCKNIRNLYVVGCEQKYREFVKEKTGNFNTISWFVIIVELASSVLACVLVDSIRNHRDRIRFYS